jgi:hypothetical protein
MRFISGFISDFVFGLLGDSVVADLGKDDLAEFDCSLRVIAGRQKGLGGGWHDGQASVYPGGLDFEASFHAKDGVRAALRTSPPPISVTVSAVATARQRQPNNAETRNVKADSQIVELTTDTATLEWAVPTKKLKAALERVQSSWSSEAPSA